MGFNDCPYGYFESAPYAIENIMTSGTLMIAVIGYILSIAAFNVCGITITKTASALSRGTIDAIRNFTVWIFSYIFFERKFYWLQLVGFIILTFGSLLFNEIIVLPGEGIQAIYQSSIS